MLCILTPLQKKRRKETKELGWEMDVDLIAGILSHVSEHQIIMLHTLNILVVFINYTSVKPENVFKN